MELCIRLGDVPPEAGGNAKGADLNLPLSRDLSSADTTPIAAPPRSSAVRGISMRSSNTMDQYKEQQ